MSKSLGNFFTIREIFEKEVQQWPEAVVGEMLRYFLLSTHYRGPLDFSDQSVHEAKKALDGFYDLFKRLREDEQGMLDEEARTIIDRARLAYRQKLDDDLNTPMALAVLQNMKTKVNIRLERWSNESRKQTRAAFREFGAVLGLFQLEPEQWQFNPLQISVHEVVVATDSASGSIQESAKAVGKASILTDTEIESQLAERLEARRKKDFAKADEIRKSLAAQGIIIEDKPDGTSRWKR
jgi:cysteinyl-tRNA synthetase